MKLVVSMFNPDAKRFKAHLKINIWLNIESVLKINLGPENPKWLTDVNPQAIYRTKLAFLIKPRKIDENLLGIAFHVGYCVYASAGFQIE